MVLPNSFSRIHFGQSSLILSFISVNPQDSPNWHGRSLFSMLPHKQRLFPFTCPLLTWA